ncbi:23S rRNA (adenine(2503)-C(2))-methyltransferase RlmN [Dehalogenimonas sp. THU2]|uniref:23S rRNA (adenine(2503)-C(2))-methyltransferase RlmN n=1 Tax=Dehalogenimonas sp. THU2 TaxID=3151121 RepID=UPI0032183FC6
MVPLLGLNTEELRTVAATSGVQAFRGNQLAEWLYQRNARDFDRMSNLPPAFLESLQKHFIIGRSKIIITQRSTDGTVKLLLELSDGARIETVGLPYSSHYSCCVSTQAGCPVGCGFCATGQSGFKRNLTAGEIIDQVLSIGEILKETGNHGRGRVDHVTFMGMGEPLLNYDATVKTLKLLNNELGLSARNLTVSTIGQVPGIRRLSQEKLPVTLAISLHAPTDDLRHQLIPGFVRWTVAEIISAGRDYVSQTGRRLTIEYCLLNDVNDHAGEAQQLADLLQGLNCHVNLIPFNPAEGLPYTASPPQHVQAFSNLLAKRGIQVTERARRGADIDAACGQLKQRNC